MAHEDLRLADERVDKLCTSAEQLAMDVNAFLTQPCNDTPPGLGELILLNSREVLMYVREIREKQGRG